MKLPDTQWLYRPAARGSFARNYGKTLAQTVVFWTIFLVVLPWIVSRLENRLGIPGFEPNRPAAVIIFVVFGSLGLSSGYTMARIGEGTPLPTDSPRKLVIAGPYRWVRNPMAVAGLVQGAATGLWFGSFLVFAYIVAGGLLWNIAIRPSEEADLEARFGEAFRDYCDEVSCWIPRLRPFSATEQTG